MAKSKKPTDLVDLIKANPGCVAQIDNDSWYLFRENPRNNPFNEDDDDDDENRYAKMENWDEDNTLISSGDAFLHRGDGGYGSGESHGGDILQALAAIVGMTIESV